jgi:ABC-type transport system involved in cytochrome c biogenesis permease component
LGISYLGSSCALNLSEQYRLVSTKNTSKLYNKTMLSFAWSMAQGTVAMFAVQIIGTSAISLTNPDGKTMDIKYRLDFLLVALVVIPLCCKSGIIACTKDEVYSMNKGKSDRYIVLCNRIKVHLYHSIVFSSSQQ